MRILNLIWKQWRELDIIYSNSQHLYFSSQKENKNLFQQNLKMCNYFTILFNLIV